jgi:hypothetical protein
VGWICITILFPGSHEPVKLHSVRLILDPLRRRLDMHLVLMTEGSDRGVETDACAPNARQKHATRSPKLSIDTKKKGPAGVEPATFSSK